MKKFFCGLSLIVTACASSVTQIPKETFYFGIDFSKYSEQGFLITPEKYTEEYTSIGLVNYVIVPGAKYVAVKTYVTQDAVQTVKEWKADKINIGEGLDSLHAIARRMGADAIVNFKAEPESRDYGFIGRPVKLSGYQLSGFAIKRKLKG